MDRRARLIVLSAKIANNKDYLTEYIDFQEEIRILDALIYELADAENAEKYKSKVHGDQLGLL